MRVLLVEDHAVLAASIAEGMRDDGYAVDLASDGREAEHLMRVNGYDCVVLDIMLPEKDGWTVLKDARCAGITTPILCLTARDALTDRVKGLNFGADDYLVKPFEWDELAARVRALIRRSHGKTSAVIQVADLEVDLSAKTVRRAGRPITLTSREFALLEYLAPARWTSGVAHRHLGTPVRRQRPIDEQRGGCVHRLSAEQDRSGVCDETDSYTARAGVRAERRAKRREWMTRRIALAILVTVWSMLAIGGGGAYWGVRDAAGRPG